MSTDNTEVKDGLVAEENAADVAAPAIDNGPERDEAGIRKDLNTIADQRSSATTEDAPAEEPAADEELPSDEEVADAPAEEILNDEELGNEDEEVA